MAEQVGIERVAGTVVAEQDKTNLAAVVIEIAQFERMQARRQRNLSALFEQRMFSVVINHHPAADTQDGAVVGSERKGIDPGCRNVDIPPENHPDGPAAGSRTRETDRIDDTTAAGSVKSLRNADRVATGKTAEVPIDAQTGFSVPRLQRPRIILLLIADDYPVARTAVGMVGPDVQRTIVADNQRGVVTRRVYGRHRAVERIAQNGTGQRTDDGSPDRIGEDADSMIIRQRRNPIVDTLIIQPSAIVQQPRHESVLVKLARLGPPFLGQNEQARVKHIFRTGPRRDFFGPEVALHAFDQPFLRIGQRVRQHIEATDARERVCTAPQKLDTFGVFFMKYNYEIRLKAVKLVLEGGLSVREAGCHLGCGRSQVHLWVTLFERHGLAGLKLRHGSYSAEFKLSVLKHMHQNHLSLLETAVHFGIPGPFVIRQWERLYQNQGAEGLRRKPQRRRPAMSKSKTKKVKLKTTPHEELLKELEYLRAENAYLKKLQALVEERIVRESGKEPKPSKD